MSSVLLLRRRRRRDGPDPVHRAVPGRSVLVYYNTRVHTEDYAAFTHLDWHVTDALTLYGGIRYTDEIKELESERRVLPASYVIPPGFIPGLTTDGTGLPPQVATELDSEEVTWEAGIKYEFSESSMVYAEVVDGLQVGRVQHPRRCDRGARASHCLRDRREVRLSERSHEPERRSVLQRLRGPAGARSLDLTTVPITVVLHNAASVVAKGLEVEVEAIPIDHLTVHSGVGYVDSTYEEFENVPSRTGGVIDASGNDLPMTPPWTVNGGFRYDQSLGSGVLVWRC